MVHFMQLHKNSIIDVWKDTSNSVDFTPFWKKNLFLGTHVILSVFLFIGTS